MVEQRSAAPDQIAGAAHWRTVLRAIENERHLDVRYRAKSTNLGQDRSVPNYKVMKQLALRRTLGVFYRPVVLLAPWAIPVLALAQWAGALIALIFDRSKPAHPSVYVIATTPANAGLIDAALMTDTRSSDGLPARVILKPRELRQGIGVGGVLRCIGSHFRLLTEVVRADAAMRADLLLHARDALNLLMLASFSQRHPKSRFATDDHYQRWAFVLSHHCRGLSIVQHGILDPDIDFPHAFGTAETVYVRDPLSGSQFAAYYRIDNVRTFAPATQLARNPVSDTAIFLASSFPWIDAEIQMLTLIKAQYDVPVIVKLHPAHLYDGRRHALVALSAHVCSDVETPACRIFVSHSSSMELDYKALGIPTFSIARSGGAEAAANAVLAFLGQPSAAGGASTADPASFLP